MSFSPLSRVVPLVRPLPLQDFSTEASAASPACSVVAESQGGPILVLIGEKLRTVALARRLERAGLRVARVTAARIALLRADKLCGVLLPTREIEPAVVGALAARAQIDPAWREVPLIVAGPAPEALWPAAASLGPHLLPDLVESPVSMASLRRIIGMRLRVLAAYETELRRDDSADALSRRLEEEALLRREAEHRNKNILQMACSILMLEMAGDSGSDSAGLARATERIRNLTHIQELLRDAADARTVRLDDLLPRLARLITESTPAQLVVDADIVEAPPEKAVAAGLITAEAVMNALKHAGQADGAIKVRIGVRLRRNGSALIEIADNGPGISAEARRGARRFGGIQIMTMLAERLGAQLLIDCSGGTRISVSFPLLDV